MEEQPGRGHQRGPGGHQWPEKATHGQLFLRCSEKKLSPSVPGDWSSELSFGRTRPERPRRTLPSRDKYITTRDKYITTHIQVPRRLQEAYFQEVIKRPFYNHLSGRPNSFLIVLKKEYKFSRQTQKYVSTHLASVTIFRER